MRQRLKSRMNPRGRPHLKQRRTVRLENFGFRLAFMIIDFLAMYRLPRGDWEALASGACAADLQKLLRVTLFFVQPVVEKQSPLRGLHNICDMDLEVNPHGV